MPYIQQVSKELPWFARRRQAGWLLLASCLPASGCASSLLHQMSVAFECTEWSRLPELLDLMCIIKLVSFGQLTTYL